MTMPFTEDTLVQQTTAEYLRNELGWEAADCFHVRLNYSRHNNPQTAPDQIDFYMMRIQVCKFALKMG